jgi:hypothetical protein
VHICLIVFLMYVEKQRCFLLEYLWSMDLIPGSVGNFYILFLRKICFCTCSEQILETVHAPPPPPFSISHTKPHNSSPTFVCLQHLIQYICSRFPWWRMCNVSELENDTLTFPSDVCGHRKQAGRTDIVQHGSPTCSSQPHW